MADATAETDTFEAKFAKWKKGYKGYDLNSTKPYRVPREGVHLVASLAHPEVQYDARDPTFIRRSTAKDSDEIKEQFKPGKGVDAAVFFKTATDELRAQMFESCQAKMEELLQKRREDAAAFIPEYEDLQKQLLEAIKDWRSATETATRVQAVLRVGDLQNRLAETDEKRRKGMYPHTHVIAYKPDHKLSKKTTVAIWKTKDAAAEDEAAPAEKKKFGASSTKTDTNGYRLVRSMTNAVDRTIPLTEGGTA